MALGNTKQSYSTTIPPPGDPVARIRVRIEREINDRVSGETLVPSRECVDEELPLIVAAVGYVEQEVPVAWKEYAPQHLRAIVGPLNPSPSVIAK